MSESELVNTNQILLYWFRDAGQTEMFAFWFDTTPDQYITKTYKELVDTITIDNYKQYCLRLQKYQSLNMYPQNMLRFQV